MAKIPTLFQRLGKKLPNESTISADYSNPNKTVHSYDIKDNNILFKTKDKNEYEKKLSELHQNSALGRLWRRIGRDLTIENQSNTSAIKMMFNDADLMDGFPELGTAMDIMTEEVTASSQEGYIVNVNSESDRIKAVLQDLIVNRLSSNTMIPMIARATIKYGNCFMFLNVSVDNGIKGWKMLPVYEVERYESGMLNPYLSNFSSIEKNDNGMDTEDSTKFVWIGGTTSPTHCYFNWQMAHFRLLYDSQFLPYGTSAFNKARRHFRMLSCMEDLMLMYRMDRSVERRKFKIDVGDIDPDDVEQYMDEVANSVKRTPIIDQKTGQLDIRSLAISPLDDFFIPIRSHDDATDIETLSGGQNLTAMDDIKYIQNKICTALRVPKSFLNFEETQGDGKNLSLMDVRFSKTVNRIQQMLLMELNKVCIIHLYLLGFTDDLTNFTLTMNNPSSQAEMMELENLSKKIDMARNAVSDAGLGLPLYSMKKAQKDIMGWSDSEIKENLMQVRIESALSEELKKTNQIISRTHMFDPVDKMYGEIGAEYQANEGGDAAGGEGPSMGGGGGMPSFGDEIGGGETGGEEMQGNEGEVGMDQGTSEMPPEGGNGELPPSNDNTQAPEANNPPENNNPQESKKRNKKRHIIHENMETKKSEIPNVPILDKNFLINEDLDTMRIKMEELINRHKNEKLTE